MESSSREVRRSFVSSHEIFKGTNVEVCVEVEETMKVDSIGKTTIENDVKTVLETLPNDLRKICEMIMQGYSIRRIAAVMDVSVGTLYKSHFIKLREIFTRYGF